ncbi:hypothetical protein D3C73_892310 [compost metagenome]
MYDSAVLQSVPAVLQTAPEVLRIGPAILHSLFGIRYTAAGLPSVSIQNSR